MVISVSANAIEEEDEMPIVCFNSLPACFYYNIHYLRCILLQLLPKFLGLKMNMNILSFLIV